MAGQQKPKKGPGGGGRGGGPRKPQGKGAAVTPHGKPAAKPAKQQQAGSSKRKAPEGVQKASLGKPSGDVDDFAFMLDEMEDYKPTDVGAGSESDGEQAQQQDAQQQAGSGDDEGAPAVAAGGAGDSAEGKRVKKRRKRGQKLSSMEFEASRQMARQIAECSGEEQADWLWASYQQQAAASTLERGGLTEAGMVALPAEGGLEERLKTLAAGGWWREAFCSRGGPKGSPTLLLVSPSAIGAVGLIKHCPQFNMACRIGKMFAKHFKVAEQEEVLRTQVMCLAAGTPNRMCKLADGGALKLGRLTHVVLDVFLDVKQRDILAIPETRADWWQFYERHLKQRVDAGSLRLALVNSDQLGGGGGSSS